LKLKEIVYIAFCQTPNLFSVAVGPLTSIFSHKIEVDRVNMKM